MNPEILERVMQRMAQQGWQIDPVWGCLATKDFATAVGPKQASVWLTDDREFPRYWLHGSYYSEGRDALAACYGIIPAIAEMADIDALVDQFLTDVAHTVGSTYAARLLRYASPAEM